MKIDEIEAAVQTYRDQQSVAAHARINALAFRQQEPEMVAREMAGVDARVAVYAASLGQPDAQSIAQEPDESQPEPQDEPAPAIVLPGVKS